MSILSTEWKENLSFLQVEHSHRKLTILLLLTSSACFSLLHFLWTTELQVLQDTPVSALLFLLSNTTDYWEILWIEKGIIILIFIFSFVIFMQFDQLIICQLKERKQSFLHGLQYQRSSLSEFCKSSYSFLLIPAHDLWTQRLHILQRIPGCLS